MIAVSWQAGTHSRTAKHVEELHRGHSQIALQSFCTVLPLPLEQVSSFCDTLGQMFKGFYWLHEQTQDQV